MTKNEMETRIRTPENFSNSEWHNGYVHGLEGKAPRHESEEYKNGYAHGWMSDGNQNDWE
jgi:hypothetical protein